MYSLGLLFLTFPASTSPYIITFHPPVLIGEEGLYVDAVRNIGGALLAQTSPFVPGYDHYRQSLDNGQTFISGPPSCASPLPWGELGGIDQVPIPPFTLRNYGTVGQVPDRSKSYTSFTSPASMEFSFSAAGGEGWGGGGEVVCKESSTGINVTFSGLPTPVYCGSSKDAFGCPFRLAGGGFVALPSPGLSSTSPPTLLYSAIVYWGGAGPSATSIVAFASQDGGSSWGYLSTIANASDYPLSQEGPNENTLALTSDGKAVVCVFRTDAGDGPTSHPYAPYHAAFSTDGGASWTRQATPMPGVGCARPRLMHLGVDREGGSTGTVGKLVQAAPLVLTGGRLRGYNTSSSSTSISGGVKMEGEEGGWDPLLWVNVDSTSAPTQWGPPHSLSFWHNSLSPNASWKFTPDVNSSTSPRQSTAYTSLLDLDQGPILGVRSRRVGVTYNRALPGANLAFLMPFTVEW